MGPSLEDTFLDTTDHDTCTRLFISSSPAPVQASHSRGDGRMSPIMALLQLHRTLHTCHTCKHLFNITDINDYDNDDIDTASS
jgi:hypothetical protein